MFWGQVLLIFSTPRLVLVLFLSGCEKCRVNPRPGSKVLGTEIDAESQRQALEGGLSSSADLANVEIGDFVVQPLKRRFDAVVANPPYILHHRLGQGTKAFLKQFGASLIGRPLDGRAGYHAYTFSCVVCKPCPKAGG